MNKLKNILMCIAIATMTNSFGQTASGVVIYKIQLIGFGAESTNPEYKELNESIVAIANKKTATLTFNNMQSSYILDKHLVSENNNNGVTIMAEKIAFIEINGNNFFLDKNKNNIVLQNMDGILIEKPHEKLEWEITTESKIIDGYLCYKAIYLMKFVNRRGMNTSIPILAWFAPSLPYSYGPKYFNGLPGLILELTDRRVTFLASSINILKDKIVKIDFPKGKTVSQEQYSKKVLSN